MKEALIKIIERIRSAGALSDKELDILLREASRALDDPSRRLSKRRMLAFYLQERDASSAFFSSLRIDAALDEQLIQMLRAKPRRTASGVATVTVLTKPWPCKNDCIYCPNDVTMPKSYIADEPACQRAERCCFDPYLQVAARLTTLANMGHNTDKVELIVLGGTWFDYPQRYRLWFSCQLFAALDDFGSARMDEEVARRRGAYEALLAEEQEGRALSERIRCAHVDLQRKVDAGAITYAQAFHELAPLRQRALPDLDDAPTEELLGALQRANEDARARCVGLVVETRPDTVTCEALAELRAMGVTKVQVGVQSLDDAVLDASERADRVCDVERALGLIRVFGFKSHVHMMANLIGSAPEDDLRHYRKLMEDARFKPDEVKLYPCALVESARLTEAFEQGAWAPYGEDELVELLSACVLATPEHTRISRMIRDIPSNDILIGCKKTNLRQIVEREVLAREDAGRVREMRMREVATGEIKADDLALRIVGYRTANTRESFLQWVDGAGKLAGFLRLSIPDVRVVEAMLSSGERLPVCAGEAMIREVHIYGKTSRLHESREGNQHLGLGRQLVERACQMAKEEGCASVNVISAVGTRAYYRRLGFEDAGLYQKRILR